jgi:hypothetical protein
MTKREAWTAIAVAFEKAGNGAPRTTSLTKYGLCWASAED